MADPEVDVALLRYRMDEHAKKLAEMDTKIDMLVELFQQARGAKWLLLTMSGVGGFVAAKAALLSSWIMSAPK